MPLYSDWWRTRAVRRRNLNDHSLKMPDTHTLSPVSYLYSPKLQTSQSVVSKVDLQTDELSPSLYERGQHQFLFTLIIPSYSAPTERSPRGRLTYQVVATAITDGMRKSKLESSVPISLVTNPAPYVLVLVLPPSFSRKPFRSFLINKMRSVGSAIPVN